jgi:hypothetical protein
LAILEVHLVALAGPTRNAARQKPIEKAVIDVSGRRYVDHEAEVRGCFMLD